MIEELAQAIYEKQQEERVQKDIEDVGYQIEEN